MSAERVRAFVALDIEPETRARLADGINELKPGLPQVRFVPTDQLHLTLRFFGDVPRAALMQLTAALADAAHACPPADVAFEGVGTFPERGHPRVLWLGLALPETILALQDACERAAQAIGLAAETRPFRPHLTLGRWRSPAPHPQLPALAMGRTRLARIVLYQSVLQPAGAVHTPLATLALGSAS